LIDISMRVTNFDNAVALKIVVARIAARRAVPL